MQGGRGSRDRFFDFGDPFAGFGGFGGQRSLMSSFFGERNPFDDPFFTRPFGGMFESNFVDPIGSRFVDTQASGFLEHQPSQTNKSRGPIIVELNSDDENAVDDRKEKKDNRRKLGRSFVDTHASGFIEHQPSQPDKSRGPIIEELNSDDENEVDGRKEKKYKPRKHGRTSKEPYVDDPDDEAEAEAEERESKQIQYSNEINRMKNTRSHPQAHSFTFQSSTVTHGGSNGAYYTKSATRRTGSDGLTLEESKEADSATGQAAHRLLRGIHDKGHAISRKLNSDGRVDTMQSLHNLNEDELTGFEEAWKGNARKNLPGWTEGININDGHGTSAQNGPPSRGGWALPSTERTHSKKMKADVGDKTGPSQRRLRTTGTSKMDKVRRN